ncbi:helix-turn-helix domain-containing protein [Aquabacterium sp. OR-4]|uniref:helix-turn-helix domain-containing protein n=1 Tax=Aquabacterium sp. OR-4 TaxID=2978127 RepID=UPI0028C68EC9|nr:helix-turn-helix domain-containing protein [Aquabacterium sp. OR-4]MDT7834236.1 helix-turn-helix domain-containing protein [Aquabacterium sp. OR-4]
MPQRPSHAAEDALPGPQAGPPASPAAAAPPGLPSYALYGEHGRTEAVDWLHCEDIASRSSRHDWEIRPHRHAVLFQILYIARGRAQAQLEGRALALRGPCVLLVPALVPHGFSFEPGIDGLVLTVLEAHLAQRLAATPALAAALMQARHLAWPSAQAPAARAVAEALARLQAEFRAAEAWRDLMLDAALLQLAVALGRAAPALPGRSAESATGPARATAHVRRYRALVEAQFRQQPALAALAAEVGITPTQLNRVCHQVLGHAALAVLHNRLLLEAQRDLAYTTLSIKQVALGLGFADAGYFSRFFRHHTGHAPSRWRALSAAAGTGPAASA